MLLCLHGHVVHLQSRVTEKLIWGLQVKAQLDTVPPFHTNSFKGQLHSSSLRRKLNTIERHGKDLLQDARFESYAPGLQLEIEVQLLYFTIRHQTCLIST